MAELTKVSRILISCVTTDVVKITEPAFEYGVERVYLLNYIKSAKNNDSNEISRQHLYESVFEEVVNSFNRRKIEVKSCRNIKTYNFDECFHAVYDIIVLESKLKSTIYVNISGGTPEYAAAASIASMMHSNVILFSVGIPSDGHTIPFSKMEEMLTYDGKLVGEGFKTHKPFEIDKFPLDLPNIELLKALKVFSTVALNSRSNVNVVRKLIDNRLWKFGNYNSDNKIGTSVEFENDEGKCITNREEYDKRQKKEAVQYQRAFIKKWLDYDWIERSEYNRRKYELSEKGERYLRVFCSDEVFQVKNS